MVHVMDLSIEYNYEREIKENPLNYKTQWKRGSGY